MSASRLGSSGGAGRMIKKIVIAVVVVAVAPFAMPAFARFAGGSSGYQDVVMNKLRTCVAAQQLLGNDIDIALIGLAWGSSETQNGMYGHANWRVPVSGSLGSGTYEYAMELHGGQWQMFSGLLDVNGQVVDVASCTPSAGGIAAAPGAMGTIPGAQGGQAQAAAMAAAQCYQRGDMACVEVQSRTACNLGDTGSCSNLAHILMNEKNDPRGAADAARIACDAGSSSGCENLGTALKAIGDSAGAYQAMSTSCTLGLDIGCANLANLDLQRGDPNTAFLSANRALQINANRSSAFRQLGHGYLFLGYVDKAVEQYNQAIVTAPIADQGRSVTEDAKKPPVQLIREEITALGPVYPARSSEIQQVLGRLATMGSAAR